MLCLQMVGQAIQFGDIARNLGLLSNVVGAKSGETTTFKQGTSLG